MSKKIAFCSLVTAVGTVFLYLASTLGTLRISCLVLASLVLILPVARYGVKNAFLCFAATSLLGLFLPDKMILVAYAAFFGNYTIVKSLIERIGNLYAEWAAKLVWFAAVAIAAVNFVTFNTNFAKTYIAVGVVMLCAAYDVFLSFAASYILSRFSRHIK